MAFKFKFESILNLKTRLEDMKKAEFKNAMERLEAEKEKLRFLVKSREEQYDIIKEKQEKGLKPKELIDFNNYILVLKNRIKNQKQRVLDASNAVENLRQELIKVSKEKKMFEILKERKKEEYLKAYYKKEQETTDDIVSFRYNGGVKNG